MIRLKRLELQGFRQFRDLQVVDFPETGLLLLEGDSGAGKSTLMQAIAYALDICPFPSTTLRAWTGETFQVVLTLATPDGDVVISRGKKTSIQFGDSPPNTGAKALEEGLVRLFGMSSDLLQALTYRPQDTLGIFLSKDDAKKKEFLGRVLGLSGLETALEDSYDKRKSLQNDLSFAQGVLAEREGALRQLLAGVVEISPDPDDTGLAERLSAAQRAFTATEAALELASQGQKAAVEVFHAESEVVKASKLQLLETAKHHFATLKTANDRANAELEIKRQGVRDQIVRVGQAINEIDAAARKVTETKNRIRSLESNKCYVCNQNFIGEIALDEEREILAGLTTQIAGREVQAKRLQELSEQLRAMVPIVDPKLPKFTKIVSDLESEIRLIGKTVTDTRVIAAQAAYSAALTAHMTAKSDLFEAEEAVRRQERAVQMKEKLRQSQVLARDKAVKLVDEKREDVAKLESQLNAEKDFAAVLGRDGFLGAIFDEVLESISGFANTILASIPNTAHISVHFSTENVNGKKTITPMFVVNGHETTRQSGLSGGMGASADLAVDLGVAAVVEQRLGKAPAWICLDETFNGMPRATKEAALEALQKVAQNKLVIVIDHGSEFRELFTKVLTVTCSDGRSSVL